MFKFIWKSSVDCRLELNHFLREIFETQMTKAKIDHCTLFYVMMSIRINRDIKEISILILLYYGSVSALFTYLINSNYHLIITVSLSHTLISFFTVEAHHHPIVSSFYLPLYTSLSYFLSSPLSRLSTPSEGVIWSWRQIFTIHVTLPWLCLTVCGNKHLPTLFIHLQDKN